MAGKIYQVLFVCTGNSARSILAEGLLNSLGKGRFVAHSAGSQPKDRPHPLALKTLAAHGMPIDGFRSKSWDESPKPVRRRWTSCSRCATRPPARPARTGPASR
jgi:arsenate reductase